MRRIRILLIDMPRMLRELIHATVSEDSDLEVVGSLERTVSLAEAIRGAAADVVIVGAEVFAPEDVAEALRLQPSAKVLRISADGRESSLWELRPYEQRLGDAGPDQLLAAIRDGLPV